MSTSADRAVWLYPRQTLAAVLSRIARALHVPAALPDRDAHPPRLRCGEHDRSSRSIPHIFLHPRALHGYAARCDQQIAAHERHREASAAPRDQAQVMTERAHDGVLRYAHSVEPDAPGSAFVGA